MRWICHMGQCGILHVVVFIVHCSGNTRLLHSSLSQNQMVSGAAERCSFREESGLSMCWVTPLVWIQTQQNTKESHRITEVISELGNNAWDATEPIFIQPSHEFCMYMCFYVFELDIRDHTSDFFFHLFFFMKINSPKTWGQYCVCYDCFLLRFTKMMSNVLSSATL